MLILRRALAFASGAALVVAVFLLALALSKSARAGGEDSRGSFFTYTMPNGTLSFTDSERRVPAAAKNVFERTWEELEASQIHRETEMSMSDYHFHRLPIDPTPLPNPNHLTDCTGAVTVESARVQFGAVNRRMYSVVDSCGRVISTAPNQPVVIVPSQR